jgi:hypothetical protein
VRDRNVRRLQIAMDDPLFVCGIERVRNLPCDLQGFAPRHRAGAQTIRQRLPFDQLEDERVHAVAVLEAVDRRDVRMGQRRKNAGLTLESGAPVRIVDDRTRENLDGDVAIERRVAGAVNLAHATRSNQRLNVIRTKALADKGLCHVCRRAIRYARLVTASGDQSVIQSIDGWRSSQKITRCRPLARCCGVPLD